MIDQESHPILEVPDAIDKHQIDGFLDKSYSIYQHVYIQKVELVNFMCHGQAIIRIKLGVKEGGEFNQFQKYGSSITIERRLLHSGQSYYKISDHNDNVLSTSRHDLNKILEYFNIAVDNPCSILMQETSKNFLSTNEPGKKYELFMQATQLESIKYELDKANEMNHSLLQVLAMKEKAIPFMRDKLLSLKREMEAIKLLDDQRSSLRSLRNELAWVHVANLTTNLAQLEAKFEKKENDILTIKKHLQSDENSLMQLSNASNVKQESGRSLDERYNALNERRQQTHAEMQQLQLSLSSFQSDASYLEQESIRLETRFQKVQQEIKELREKSERNDDEINEQKKRQLLLKQRELSTCQEEIQVLETRMNQLVQIINHESEELTTLRQKLENNRLSIAKREQNISKLQAQSQDRSRAFGHKTTELHNYLKVHKDRFSAIPLGPIGIYVTVKDKKWCDPVDVICGSVLNAYVVNMRADVPIFQAVCNRYQIPCPRLIVMSHRSQPYHIPDHNSPDPRLYISTLSVIDVEHEVVRNVLIDFCNIESKILFHNLEQAEKAMFSPNANGMNPANVTHSITMDGIFVYWSQGTQKVHGSNITSPRLAGPNLTHIADERKAVEEMHIVASNIQQALSQKEPHINLMNRELGQVQAHIKTLSNQQILLQNEIDDTLQPFETNPTFIHLKELESNAKQLEDRMDDKRSQITEIREKKIGIEEKHATLSTLFEATKSELEQVQLEMEKVTRDLNSIDRLNQKYRERIANYSSAIENVKSSQESLNQQISESRIQIEEDSIKASQLAPRPEHPITETHEEIQKKITAIENAIEEQRKNHRPTNDINTEYKSLSSLLTNLTESIADLRKLSEKIQRMIAYRIQIWQSFRLSIANRTRSLFVAYLSQRNFSGQLVFDHKSRKLNIMINPNNSDGANQASSSVRDTSTLSGGERSYSTLSFLLALWECMEAPIRAMDEIDVFMDMVNQQISLALILKTAQENNHRQHIILTPNELHNVKPNNMVKILKMKPPERNQPTLDEMTMRDL